MQDIFDQAVEAAVNYIDSSITTRADRYRFLALTYLAHREGQQDRQEFDKRLTSRLHREPTEPERKRPFLRVMHAMLNEETIAPLQHRPQYTKLTNALERIREEFEHTDTVTVDGVIDFITENGGVSGLYASSREGHSLESETDTVTLPLIPVKKAAHAGTGAKTRAQRKGGKPKASRVAAGTNQGPSQGAPEWQDAQDEPIEIANLGAWVIRDGEDRRLKIPTFSQGEHHVCLRVGHVREGSSAMVLTGRSHTCSIVIVG